MNHEVIQIEGYIIDVVFSVNKYDTDGILACLHHVNAPIVAIERAIRMMNSNRYNRGFSYANTDTKKGIIIIGPATSEKQFSKSYDRELRRITDAIVGAT